MYETLNSMTQPKPPDKDSAFLPFRERRRASGLGEGEVHFKDQEIVLLEANLD